MSGNWPFEGAVCVWWGRESGEYGHVRSQWFESVEDAEKFATTCEPWAIVVMGGEGEFAGSISTHGEYPFPAFGGEV